MTCVDVVSMRKQLGGSKRSTSSVSAASTPTKVTGETLQNPKPKKRPLTVLEKTRREMTDKELAKGFLDVNGEEVWILKEIMAYDPERGYKVKCVGWPEPTCMSLLFFFFCFFASSSAKALSSGLS